MLHFSSDFFHICYKFSTKGQFLNHTKEHMFYETKKKRKNENEARSSVASPPPPPFPTAPSPLHGHI